MKISVLIPVFGTPIEWAKQAIESIFDQDKPSECPQIVIVDDNNPKGDLRDYLYDDVFHIGDCVHIVRKEENEGIAAALNYGLQHCSGDLIVRMDSDDIAHPSLLRMHEEYFTEHLDRHICGVQIKLFSETKIWYSRHRPVITKEYAASKEAGYWFVNHPGIAFRKSAISEIGGYGSCRREFPEDYALWIKFLKAGYIIYNREEVLMDYRVKKQNPGNQDRKSLEWMNFLYKQKKSLYE
jgi:cellulose synthase/poly-beta-1,6-N-acetylglucosamine synthase-like glycosyltransferase